MNTDLFLRRKAKAQPTDLWLHPAGPDSGTGLVAASGTVVSVAVHDALYSVRSPITASSGYGGPPVITRDLLLVEADDELSLLLAFA